MTTTFASAFVFQARSYKIDYNNADKRTTHISSINNVEIASKRGRTTTSLQMTAFPGADIVLNGDEAHLAFWMFAFSSSHIGMSSIRENLIQGCGKLAADINLVNQGLTLPSWWPGDDIGPNEVFPDVDTAGRQIYRILYTFVSFVTLGSALDVYLDLNNNAMAEPLVTATTETERLVCFAIAVLSGAASIASLFNASPLSLVPGFQKVDKDSHSDLQDDRPVVAGIQRNDASKMEPKGLTRITRHPLILPVVPWGIATSILAGGRVMDFLLFGGLSLYAIAGCACQDLRIIRKEGSVGTVFLPSSLSSVNEEKMISTRPLDSFYESTSFLPFAAVFDGRQSMTTVTKEFPIIPFLLGFPVSVVIEKVIGFKFKEQGIR